MISFMHHTPNVITCLRLIFLPVFLYCMLKEEMKLAFHLFIVMGVSDALDGWLAKRYGWCSRLGSFLDPLADKFMLVGAFVVLAWLGLLPVWFVILAIVRDVAIGLGYLWLRYDQASAPEFINPSKLSKMNTVFQVAVVLLVLVQASYVVPAEWLTFLAEGTAMITFASAIITIASGCDYARAFLQPRSRRARRLFSRPT